MIHYQIQALSFNARRPRTKRLVEAIAVILLATLPSGAEAQASGFILVQDGTPRVAIVADIPKEADESGAAGVRKACELMQMAVERSTKAKLDILPAQKARTEARERKLILVGGGELTREAGIEIKPLPPEGYRIVVQPERCAFYGDLDPAGGKAKHHGSMAATPYFAVAEVVQNQWQGRWLWPGPDGFSIPRRADLSLAFGDDTLQPKFEIRWFSLPSSMRGRNGKKKPLSKQLEIDPEVWETVQEQLTEWFYFHRFGSRLERGSQHSYQDWWEKYHESNPDLFAQPIPGVTQPSPKPEGVKLRLGNPKVAEQVVAEWRAKGRPQQWGIGPNDGAGFCTAPETMAMDEPPGQDPVAIWNGKADLSARYSRFWARLLELFKKEKPDVQLTTLIYSCYRNAPAKEADLKGLLGGFVHAWTPAARESWSAWRAAGARLFLRPNWTHLGAAAPYIQPHAMGEFIRWTAGNGSLGFYFDSMHGNWATQGFTYYLIARLGENPQFTVDQIVDEYTSAFGAAKPLIADYLRYWEDYSTQCAYPVSAGGVVSIDPNGAYERLVREKGIPPNALFGSHHALAYLYPDEVIRPARQILKEAAQRVAGEEEEIQERVRFLELGLDHLVLNRDAVILAYKAGSKANPQQREEYDKKVRELNDFRIKVTPLNVVWARVSHEIDVRRNSPAGSLKNVRKKIDDRGL